LKTICPHCINEILPNEDARIDASGRAFHVECMGRLAVGSVGHQRGECECHDQKDASEFGMTAREAAQRAWAYHLHNVKGQPGAEVPDMRLRIDGRHLTAKQQRRVAEMSAQIGLFIAQYVNARTPDTKEGVAEMMELIQLIPHALAGCMQAHQAGAVAAIEHWPAGGE
jgi:hypothetical protein